MAPQGRGYSWEEGTGTVEGGEPVGEGFQGCQEQCFIQIDEEDPQKFLKY